MADENVTPEEPRPDKAPKANRGQARKAEVHARNADRRNAQAERKSERERQREAIKAARDANKNGPAIQPEGNDDEGNPDPEGVDA